MNPNINLKLSSFQRINLIDVGHHKAHFTNDFIQKYCQDKDVFICAVDPINYETNSYSVFFQCAVGTKVGKLKFNLYDEPGCNSLLEMKLEDISLNRELDGWFSNHNINKIGEIEVECVTLKSILDKINLDLIHYLKVDAQGNDLDVIKSSSDWLDKTIFVQIESCTSKSIKNFMYHGQTSVEEDINFMESIGFKLFEKLDHSEKSCPEADLIFLNKKFI
jgi:FkbM family methyltransferase